MEKSISEMSLEELRFHYEWTKAQYGDVVHDSFVLTSICDRFVELTGRPVMEEIEEVILGKR